MAIYNGVATKSGRVGGSVFAMRSGICVERQYNPFVMNPKSEMQIEQRAKLKLASQLSAILGKDELVGFKPVGMMTSRNQFVKDLFDRGVVQFSNNEASIQLTRVRLTGSSLDMIRGIDLVRNGYTITVTGEMLPEFVGNGVGVRYIAMFSRSVEGETKLAIADMGTLTVSNTGAITGTINNVGSQGVTVFFYAYKPETALTLVKYNDMITTGTVVEVALDVLRRTAPSGMLFSSTLSQNVPAGE